ncbi:ClbS/DfsB family four-helix bundle protein [Mediterraneibacter glycyrrhizinilyticus]
MREEDKKHGIYKFIHVNTVAPFGTFRTKIRKWKKTAL